MPNELPRDENGHDVVEFELDHFEGGGVAVAGEVADEAAVFVDLLGACAVGDAGGLDDGEVGGFAGGDEAGHDIGEGDEAVIVDFYFPAGSAGHDVDQLALGGFFLDCGRSGRRRLRWRRHGGDDSRSEFRIQNSEFRMRNSGEICADEEDGHEIDAVSEDQPAAEAAIEAEFAFGDGDKNEREDQERDGVDSPGETGIKEGGNGRDRGGGGGGDGGDQFQKNSEEDGGGEKDSEVEHDDADLRAEGDRGAAFAGGEDAGADHGEGEGDAEERGGDDGAGIAEVALAEGLRAAGGGPGGDGGEGQGGEEAEDLQGTGSSRRRRRLGGRLIGAGPQEEYQQALDEEGDDFEEAERAAQAEDEDEGGEDG